MKKLILTAIFASFISHTQAQSLVFATEATYPPFESVTNTGQIIGFDVDIMHALCKEIKANCTIVNAPWDSLIPSLSIGTYDAVIGAMAITPQREQVVDFTQAYYSNTISLIAKKSSQLSLNPESLKGKTIGVQGDTAFYQYLQAKYGTDIKINSYQSEESAFLDLTSGRIDGVMGDTPLILTWLKEEQHSKDYIVVGKPIDDPTFFGKGDGIAVKKGNTQLLQQLNDALAIIKKQGIYQQIVNKWFGV